ncbi:hypothetical protein MKW92_015570, partial [Papaver armeniacum]
DFLFLSSLLFSYEVLLHPTVCRLYGRELMLWLQLEVMALFMMFVLSIIYETKWFLEFFFVMVVVDLTSKQENKKS